MLTEKLTRGDSIALTKGLLIAAWRFCHNELALSVSHSLASSPDRGALGKEGRSYLPKKQMRTGRFYCFNAEINPWAASCPA